MRPIFWHAFSRSRGAILGWGLSLGVLAMYLMSFYDALAEQQEQLAQLLASYPPELMAFFGDMNTLFTPEGYLGVEFFSYMPLILGIYAILAGGDLLAADEESGTLDLLLAHPVSRARLLAGRLLAHLASLLTVLGLSWLGLVIGLQWSAIELSAAGLLWPFLSLLGQLLFWSQLTLLLSQVLPARRLAAMFSGLALVASFFVTSLARVNADLEAAARFSPLNYYQSADAISSFKGAWLGGLLALALVCAGLAAWRFQRRDIRVSGEGGWDLKWPWPARAPKP